MRWEGRTQTLQHDLFSSQCLLRRPSGLEHLTFLCISPGYNCDINQFVWTHRSCENDTGRNQTATPCCSVAQSCPTLRPHGLQRARLPCLHYLPEFSQTPVRWVDDAIKPSHPLSSPSPPALNLSQHRDLFQWVSSSYQVSFSFSISASNECSVLISFRMDWLGLLAVQGTLKSLLQHHSSKASILCHSAFFMAQLSHAYMTTRKTIVLTMWAFVSKVMSLHFNMLSRFVTAFLPRSKHISIF